LFISLCKLKELLANAEVLKGEGKSRQYCTVKVKMTSVYGNMPNKRMIRLVRKKVDEGHIKSWKEVIQRNTIKDISIKKKEDMIFWHDNIIVSSLFYTFCGRIFYHYSENK